MKILVCIKQVIDPETPVNLDERGRVVLPEGDMKYWMNRSDEFAIEEATKINDSAFESFVARVDGEGN